MGLLGDALDSALSGIFGGGSSASSSSSSGSGYVSFIDELFSSGQTAPKKVAKSQDEGMFNLGTNNERQPIGTTFMAYGKHHRNEAEALQYLDDTTCYSGSLICPGCGQEKSSPSELKRCIAQHRRDGYNC